jgi:small subunit ribosomal protein S16
LVKLRLARMGNRKRPFYRVVAAEEAHRRDGRFIEILGTYDPVKKPAAIEVKSDAVLKWLSNGAQPTDTVRRILAKAGVWAHWQSMQAGNAQIGDMTGKVEGTVERGREAAPSKKAVARIADEEKAKAEAAEAAEAAANEASSEDAAEESEEASS